jgi:hypothetical protein
LNGGAALRSTHGKTALPDGYLDAGCEVPMRTFLTVMLIWMSPSLLFVGWRLWMSRPLRDVHYRSRWIYSHALVSAPRRQIFQIQYRISKAGISYSVPGGGGVNANL